MHGLGNDFIIFDNINNSIIYEVNFIKKISNRRVGIGCDQILISMTIGTWSEGLSQFLVSL